MTSDRAKLAIHEINEQLQNGITSDVSFIDCRINHNVDLEQSSLKVVFNESCIKKILDMFNQVEKSRTQERGTFFYGRLVDKMIIFDCYKSDFKQADGVFKGAAVSMEDCLPELKKMTTPSKSNTTPYDVVMHFHIHPSYVLCKTKDGQYYEKDNNVRSLLISDNDYLSYGWLNETQQYNPNKRISYLGGLLSVNYGIEPRLACVLYDKTTKQYVNFTNIYYIVKDKVFRLNRQNISNNRLLNELDCYKIINSIRRYNNKNNVKVTI